MRTTETAVTVHKRDQEKSGQAGRRAGRWIARMNRRTVARYALLTAAGILLYIAGAAYAMRRRGYFAVGGEALALLLPVLHYIVAAIARGFARDTEDWR